MEGIEKRGFIKQTILGGISATLLSNTGSAENKSKKDNLERHSVCRPGSNKKIIIGGAGIAGLCCAYELMKKGHEVIVMEASGRHGGHVFTARDGLSDGLYGDFSQEHIARPGYTYYFEYCKEFGLDVLPYLRRKKTLRRIDGKFYQMLPNAFAKRLGQRVWLNSPIVFIRHSDTAVTVRYKRFNEVKEMSADYFVNCIPLPAFRNIPIEPAMPLEKQYIFDNLTYSSYQRIVFQESSKFWLDDGLDSINLYLDHPDLHEVWQSADEVDTHRVILLGTAPGGVSPQRVLAAFREVYPGKKDTIGQVIGKDWTREAFSSACERLPFPIGELKKLWPNVMKPRGRIHFAGAYADNLN